MKLARWFFAPLAFALLYASAGAQEPPNPAFSPAPPGTVVQSQLGYLTGEAMHGQWRAIVSKKLVGSGNGTDFYQWYLSIYALDNRTYRLKYQSPANGGPLENVTQASGGVKMWYPIQELRVAGAGAFTEGGVQQFVVQSHQAGADCGGAVVSVFGATITGQVQPVIAIRNGCALKATILHSLSPAVRDVLALTGPYYNATAPLCCPTKNNATAALKYRDGKWTQTPNYFELFIGKLPPP